MTIFIVVILTVLLLIGLMADEVIVFAITSLSVSFLFSLLVRDKEAQGALTVASGIFGLVLGVPCLLMCLILHVFGVKNEILNAICWTPRHLIGLVGVFMAGEFLGAMVREAFDCIADEIRGRKAHKKFLDEHPEIKYGYPVVMDPDEFRKNRAGDDSAGKDPRN